MKNVLSAINKTHNKNQLMTIYDFSTDENSNTTIVPGKS
jgi:hypothetical protein